MLLGKRWWDYFFKENKIVNPLKYQQTTQEYLLIIPFFCTDLRMMIFYKKNPVDLEIFDFINITAFFTIYISIKKRRNPISL